MENGFTQHHSKGLFTFYREQAEHSKVIKTLLKCGTIEKQRPNNKHYVSLSEYQCKKKPHHLHISKEIQTKTKTQTSRYQEVDEYLCKKPLLSPKHIFEPKLIQKSTRKNGFVFQLIGAKNRISRSQVESYLKKQAKVKTDVKQLMGELSARQLSNNEIKQLFLPKKEHYAKLHSLKRSPLKINAVTAHCVEQQREKTKVYDMHTQKAKEYHIPLGQLKPHRKGNQYSSTVFKDALEMRRQKLQHGVFWDQFKLKRDLLSVRHNESTENSNHLLNWNTLQESQMISIDQLSFRDELKAKDP